MRKLSDDEMKLIIGGEKPSNPCEDCNLFCHRNVDDTYGPGKCKPEEDTSICKNYCCEDVNNTYWC